MFIRKEIDLGDGKVITIETGKMAKQADGATIVRMGDTMVIATVVSSRTPPSPNQDFFPMQVEYREKYYAAGKFPGGFIKRESRPSEKEILSARLIDRALRPLFPNGYYQDTQIIISVISSDQLNDADVLGGIAASAAIMVSDIPFANSMSEVRVGRINGEFVINPTINELAQSDIDISIGGTNDTICMLEGEMNEISEAEMLEAIRFGHEAIKKICSLQDDIAAEVNKPKRSFLAIDAPDELKESIKEACEAPLKELAYMPLAKEERAEKTTAVYKSITEQILGRYKNEITAEDIAADPSKALYLNEQIISGHIHAIEKQVMRHMILDDAKRLDGRKLEEVRPISIELGLIPRAHGSALFTRGETQALVVLTLGTKKDAQMIDTLLDDTEKRFMLHYNFPPFSVGETGRVGGVGRREIGHGNLAERAVKKVVPSESEFPYTIRLVSEILESNGSSSMASVCGATLAAMDGGVPLTKPVSGIAMGLIKEDDNYAVLSDILGNEDHLGDMDFKVAGTRDGITACQMDIKIDGLDYHILEKALEQSKNGRLHILDKMTESIADPRGEIGQYAPKLSTIQVPVDAIGMIIGKGGETIRSITEETGAQINVDDDGTVTISSPNGESAAAAIETIKTLISKPEVGTIYMGKVKDIREDLGAFVEILPRTDGLVHISEIARERVNKVSDHLKQGDRVKVKLIDIRKDQRSGKIRYALSIKALLDMPAESANGPSAQEEQNQ
ncbi:MAG: polyribonucleotide nucleotidyltransferase [Chlorobium phaeobacteroides]|uniref:Polyribonucleotide nucleotidyltransferase n=1 Tax=Chlorobium phaeobacteroides (strain BS1) TaxID=331678 RepID=PNP_CHLPB|nr:RecName: Full=Polyribonucleotide nucleotidyltransferase; AltName: Full=Polynucleotide phosphorylase; Short=PNPase [Chlorobium phaeobacteroides BS1]MBC8524125.1 polyribonucleotide nucleotidyltransferase [Chlorobium phaeobacteroides]MBL6955757.1 polyribonucleotide nucleotidyltransferase [Chlorobium phaeobacteroides]NEX13864.1 polyribonucleotide nucleotidyltransferase [Prosthecochloris sp.]